VALIHHCDSSPQADALMEKRNKKQKQTKWSVFHQVGAPCWLQLAGDGDGRAMHGDAV